MIQAIEDRALITKAQAGDMRAFQQLVERHQRRGFALALALVRDENDARELVQDAFLRVFKSLPTFQGESSFYTWFYRIITNLGIDLLRKPGRHTMELEEERLGGGWDGPSGDEAEVLYVARLDGHSPLEMVRRREIAVRVEAALAALPSYHRAVILLREVEGLSYEEIAQTMGVSKGTIMSRLFHARQKLQRALGDFYEEQLGPRPTEDAPPSSAAGGAPASRGEP
ncbi:MAG TPA: sigma-70 family RNA polymerase sigma factor [Polyangiaceae bacterium]|nr:sigma-70 family RNA polymerase sigma factor [Polyangiaceae bacterium]